MKKIVYVVFSTFFFLLVLASCSRIAEEDVQILPQHFLTATLEGNNKTKTQLGGPEEGIYYPYWSAGDAVAVFADGINAPDKYTLVDGAGTGKGKFKGVISGNKMVGLYPYSALSEEGLQGNVLHLELPTVQQYAPDSFCPGSYPMVAVGSSGELSFKNLCAVLKVSMTGEQAVRSIRFVPHDEWACVSGKATVRTDFEAQPQLVMADDGNPDVTLECASVQLNSSEPTHFYLVIPAGTYRGGFTLEVTTFNGTVRRSTNADITFERSQLRAIPAFECAADGEIDPDNIPYNQIWYTGSRKISFNDGVFGQEIISHTFENGKGILTFASPVTTVGEDAFYYRYVTAVNLPDCVESIGNYAFYGNSGLISFRTPAALSSVGYYAFQDCNSLNRFYGKYATEDGAFILLEDGTLAAHAPAAMTPTVTLPTGSESLISYLFLRDKTIQHVVIPEGVNSIGNYCFYNCPSLETVTLPVSYNKIAGPPFSRNQNLRQFLGDNPFIWDNGRCLVDASGYLWAFAGKGITDFVIPEGVIAPRNESVAYQYDLRSITFPSTMYDMYGGWLYDCPNLEYLYGSSSYFAVSEDHHCEVFFNSSGNYLCVVTPVCPATYSIPADMGISVIWSYALRNNESIVDLTFPEGVTSMQGINYMTNLEVLHLPSTVTSIGSNAFADCTKLRELYLKSQVPPSYSEGNYSYQTLIGHDGLVIYVPEGCEDTYKSSSGWSKYADYIQGYKYDDLPEVDYYVSTDYSMDGYGYVTPATAGEGVNLVFMGDAFSDRQIADGTYEAVMSKMIEAFFSEEPYKSYRNLFNVQVVYVVSSTEGYDHGGQALSGWFGEGTSVGGNDNKCMEYALNYIPEDKLNSTLIIVAMNREYYAGTCYMYYDTTGDYGSGVSVAYFPLGTDDEMLSQLVCHEAGGHGFSKLADEYAYEAMGTVPEEVKENRNAMVPYGWWKNCDFTGDPTEVKWAKFLADDRYQYDGLGCFEGAFTYWKGAWRPTDNSIMRYNYGGFNAPSRESIWYRIHKLAYGSDWQYNYEDFVSYDARNRKSSASSAPERRALAPVLPPLHEPVVVPMTWQEARKKAAAKKAPVQPAQQRQLEVAQPQEAHLSLREELSRNRF